MMRREGFGAALLLAAVIASAAAAEVVPYNPGDWRKTPSAQEQTAAWPAKALRARHSASATLHCRIDAKGVPEGCRVVREDPAGEGVGEAALSLAGKYAMKRLNRPDGEAAIEVHLLEPGFTPPDWLKQPTEEDLFGVWPQAALEREQEGEATIACRLTVLGALNDCRVVAENPAGAGFGGAAILLAPQLMFKPATFNGAPVATTLRLPLRWRLRGGPHGGTGTRTGLVNDTSSMASVVSPARHWLEAPSHADIVAAFPPAAGASRQAGRVTLACIFNREGGLRSCETVVEEPRGQGFAQAAKGLAKRFRAPAEQPDGRSIAGMLVQLPIAFTPAMLSGDKPVIGKPGWAGLPNAAAVAAAYPAKARAAGVTTGRGVIVCDVQVEGALTGCRVDREDPVELGFGQAALDLSPYFRLATWTTEGLPVIGGSVRVPVRFNDEAGADAPAGAAP